MKSEITLEYLQAKSGEKILKINEYYVQSKYNPFNEAKQIVENNYTPHHVHIIFGYGCGYVVEEMLKRRAFQEKIIVIDPLFEHEQVEILHEGENLYLFDSSVISNFQLYLDSIALEARVSYKTFCLPNYDKIFPELFMELLLKIKSVQYKNRTNDYTILRYAEEWQRNFILNLRNIYSDSNIEVLQEKYSCPVIVASGGPSLNKQIPLLKKFRNSFILIAAGSTINSLLKNEIEPDYVVSIDGGEPNYKHFKDTQINNAELIYSLQHHYKVNNSFHKKGYIIGTQGFEKLRGFLIDKLNIEFPILELGGSVAHSAFNVAQYISTGPVALIGQDLAYTDNLTHAEYNKNSRKVDEKFIKEHEAFLTAGYYDDQVWTSPVFNTMRLDFEALITASPPKVPFFNCTEGGVKIKGFQQIPFKQFLEENCNLDNHIELYNNEINLTKKDIYFVYQDLIKQLESLKDVLELGIESLQKIKSGNQFNHKLIKKLDKIEKDINKYLIEVPLDPITSAISIELLNSYLPKENETKEETFERVSLQTKTLYKRILDGVNITTNFVMDAMKF
ncbi:motility associated factor glycosyltransferase family protein [Lysinibacillus sp. SGAir0095]|uniref:motility associated factor glycosyltransferase family protein n=1 Tax=Lysinibacillus sp. SGAir0095 TaxID=2070463 RepID=UPI0010CCDADC|nr:6-hydroxymethylpterin diphosphokinase MptE-like protein [Lysinibacillus sp. SGAir0095]QCR31499.1 DUF115 domain-containing protein [Lysinibacillus sp. SGAir0095]